MELDDDLCFPKATVDPRLIKLQADVTEFVTSVILNHERIFYNMIECNFPEKKIQILGTTCLSITQMITASTNDTYNRYYMQVQNGISTDLTHLIREMASNGKYGPHILLDKLIRLTIDIHHDIIREKLSTDTLDLYLKTVLEQINAYLLSANLLHSFSKGPNDGTEFYIVPDGAKAFNLSSKIVYRDDK
jgi:hypothetical protein